LRIKAPWARETAEGQRDGGGFMTIVNEGKTAEGKLRQVIAR
jgi:copper(I)-binding protein